MIDIDFAHIPTNPGCYLYLDENKKVIYVGKAKSLRKRVSQYFQKDLENQKTQALVEHINQVDYIITDNEVEALLLESTLIKQYKPKYNIDLKENYRYAYILITKEKVPRLLTVRRKGDANDGIFFGPFVDGYSRVLMVKTLNEVFRLRTCKTLPKKVCLNYHLGLCSGPCEGKIDLIEYNTRIEQAKRFLRGDYVELLQILKSEMMQFSKGQQFELAKVRRDQISALSVLSERQKVDLLKEFDQDVIGYSTDGRRIAFFVFNIIKGTINKKDEFDMALPDHYDLEKTRLEFIMQYYSDRIPPKEIIVSEEFLSQENMLLVQEALSQKLAYKVSIIIPLQGDKAKLVELAMTNADYALAGDNQSLIKLKEILNLPTIPMDIECVDISNLGDDFIVGAKIHFTNAQPNKALYRKYRIKWGKTQNDFAAIYEVIKRRLYPISIGKEKAPDLIIIDGGKGQLSAAVDAMREMNLRIPMIGLAKQDEEIFFPGLPKPLRTHKNKERNDGIYLILRIRDETHRFVIKYHRSIRDKIPDDVE